MFCHLFKLSERTSLSFNKFEACEPTCEWFKDNKCSIAEVKNENLTKEKYNWILESKVCFNTPQESKTKNTRYLSFISLIHPAHNDIWVVYSLRHNKVDDTWDPLFKMYHGTDMKEFDDIKSLNTYMKKNGYDGRLFTMNDFCKENKNVSSSEKV